jgi:hypothetical protein
VTQGKHSRSLKKHIIQTTHNHRKQHQQHARVHPMAGAAPPSAALMADAVIVTTWHFLHSPLLQVQMLRVHHVRSPQPSLVLLLPYPYLPAPACAVPAPQHAARYGGCCVSKPPTAASMAAIIIATAPVLQPPLSQVRRLRVHHHLPPLPPLLLLLPYPTMPAPACAVPAPGWCAEP